MSDFSSQLAAFANAVNDSDTLWALQQNDEWVVCDSEQFEQTDVMPLWSSEEQARAFCIDAWSDYQPAAIALDDFLEQWVQALHDDGVLLGIDWPPSQQGELAEIDPIALLKQIVGDTNS